MTIEVKISKKLIPYKVAISFLKKRVEKLKKGKSKDLLWILEHPLTYTSGIRSNKNEILDKKINLIKTNRGGKITLHNKGQKIIYFALNLNNKKKDIRNLVKQVEKSIIEFLLLYKIKASSDKKDIGIWVNKKKIGAIGIRVSRWIAYHGCSININNDLKYYKKIIPCGLDNKKITSVEKESKIKILNINNKIKNIFLRNLKNV
tara:strand:- start:405 stop:1016 length:612 start_codon:yes stop_codon:yes gene_type:complete